MADHEHVLFEYRLQIRAWGRAAFFALLDDAASQMASREFRADQLPGVRMDLDPGGGGPYRTVIQEPWTLRTDGVGLPGYPGAEGGEGQPD